MAAIQRPQGPTRPTGAELSPMDNLGDMEDWTPPSNLQAPPPLPGYGQRWVRTGIQGMDDVTNVARYRNDGWEPRPADTVPSGWSSPTIKHGEHAGYIGIHGMVLMHKRLELVERTKRYIDNKTSALMQSVDNDLLRVERKTGINFDKQGSVKVTRGRRPVIAED